MRWKLTEFKNKKFDGLIGQNTLQPLKAKINLEEEYIEINNNKIKFLHTCPYKTEEIHTLEATDISGNYADKLYRNDMNNEERISLKLILEENSDIFYQEGQQLSHTHEIRHGIITQTDRPIYTKIYRYPKIHEEEISRQISEMLDQNIIKESNSPYNSPIWIVPKKLDNSGKQKFRIVVDYRKLNEITVSDKFPIPNIENILDKLGKANYFSTLDLAKGFHQILIEDDDQRKTAFSTPFGHYEFLRMPFGLKNAPSTFQRLINSVLREYINKICVVYLDDILIFSTSIEEHIDSIKKIFAKLREHNLKLQIDKCNFFCKETDYLGHTLTSDGIKPNSTRIESIQKLKLPTTQKQIKSFLGITGYYRKFVKDYAKIAYNLTKYLKKNSKVNINDSQYIDAFEKLKNILTNPPILKYPDWSKDFKLTTDASDYALGAVLSQNEHPIAYASRTLNDHEKNYSTTEKELLAIVWAVGYFRPYIYGKQFELATDHQPLVWLHTKTKGKDINPRLQRWLLKLGEYNFKINYIKGKENKVADFMSRIDNTIGEILAIENLQEIEIADNDDNFSTAATIHSQESEQNDYFPILTTVVNRFQTQIILTDHKTEDLKIVNNNKKIFISTRDIETNYMSDLFRRHITHGRIGIFTELSDHLYNKVQLKLIELFGTNIKFVRCSFMARDIDNENDLYKQIGKYHRNETGHSGITENYEGLKTKLYHKNLKHFIQKYINNCDICNKAKYSRSPNKPKFAITETPSDSNEIVHMDVYTNKKHSFITFIDKFTKYAVALNLEDRNSKTLVEKIRMYFSLRNKPKKFVTDNEFNSINVKDFLRTENVEVHFTKPNNHTGNADVERLHSTLSEKFRTLEAQNSNLSTQERIFKCIEWYNNSIHSTTKERPMDILEGKVDKNIIFSRLKAAKDKVIAKRNENREDITRNGQEGYVKNYKALRHKYEPRYRKLTLENVHPSNIKRETKFAGQLDTTIPNLYDDASTNNGNTDNPTNQQ